MFVLHLVFLLFFYVLSFLSYVYSVICAHAPKYTSGIRLVNSWSQFTAGNHWWHRLICTAFHTWLSDDMPGVADAWMLFGIASLYLAFAWGSVSRYVMVCAILKWCHCQQPYWHHWMLWHVWRAQLMMGKALVKSRKIWPGTTCQRVLATAWIQERLHVNHIITLRRGCFRWGLVKFRGFHRSVSSIFQFSWSIVN